MSKINFSKVEQSLMEGLLKMNVQELLHLAELASFEFSLEKISKKETLEQSHKVAEALAKTLINLQKNLKFIQKHDINAYQKLGVKKKDLKIYFENPGNLKREDWAKIQEIQSKIEVYKKEIESKLPQVSDEDIIGAERKKQKYKRFNINDKWLPLK